MSLIKYILIIIIFSITTAYPNNDIKFQEWKKGFKKVALQNDISEETFDTVLANIKFLPNVIKYDRYQPEFYEDTKTYISKRTSTKKVLKGINFYKKNLNLINTIEKNYNIEKELLLSLMGIETTLVLMSVKWIFCLH